MRVFAASFREKHETELMVLHDDFEAFQLCRVSKVLDIQKPKGQCGEGGEAGTVRERGAGEGGGVEEGGGRGGGG